MIDESRWGILYCPKHEPFRPKPPLGEDRTVPKENGIEYDFVQSESTQSVDRLVKMMINNGYKTIVIVEATPHSTTP